MGGTRARLGGIEESANWIPSRTTPVYPYNLVRESVVVVVVILLKLQSTARETGDSQYRFGFVSGSDAPVARVDPFPTRARPYEDVEPVNRLKYREENGSV